MRRHVLGFSLVIVLTFACAARADWPNLNPFSSGTKKSTTQKVNNSNSSSWLPSWGKSSPQRGPTTWQKIQAAPGNAWNKTKQTLSPLNPFQSQPKKKTSLNTSLKKKNEPSGFWPKWMTVEEKQEMDGPITVSDWLNQSKPGDDY
jgi:hypothetical protein